jgi:hypothetical protein
LPSWPQAELSRAAVSDLAFELPTGAQDADKRAGRRYSTNLFLQWLETWPGDTWQQRWEASGVETHGRRWREAPTAFVFKQIEASEFVARRHVVAGTGCLLCLRVLRPGYDWMVTSHFSDTYRSIRALVDPAFFDEVIERSQHAGHRERVRVDALNHLTRVIMHTGLAPRDLAPGDLLAYRAALLVSGRQADSLGLAWDMLRHANVFPTDIPTLQAARRRGQQSLAELVDGYQLACRPVRDVIVRYLTERSAGVDYVTLRGLVAHLAGYFWNDLEEHHPGIDSLDLAPEVTAAWKQRAGLLRHGPSKGQPRQDRYSILFTVRALYLDIAQWAVEDPSWASWAVRCPIRDEDVRGSMKHQRHRRARMHQRTRTLAPLLPELVRSVEDHLGWAEQLLTAAQATAIGDTFTLNGVLFRRTQAKTDVAQGGQQGARRTRAQRLDTDEAIDVTKVEDEAFWTWAIVETLRHTGARHEEMLELSHFALSTHVLPDTGEVVPLLQIAPSKLDQERVLLVSPELAHVLARVVQRVRGGNQQVPLVARYDHYERVTCLPLPLLFQRRFGASLRAMSPSTTHRLLKLAIDRAQLTGPDGQPLHYTPHDFRRIFATDAVSGGLPVHIAAKLLGHADLNTTQTYVAVYQDDVLRHHRAFIAQRRATRPATEYREPTTAEWAEFEQHFTKRKVELGTCARPYGGPCRHEHACIRCPMLRPDPGQEPRLLAVIVNLNDRLREATERGWLGEVDGLKVSLDAANQKLTQMRKFRAQARTVDLPTPMPLRRT